MIIEDKYLIRSIQFDQQNIKSKPNLNIELIGNKTYVKMNILYKMDYIQKQIFNIYKNNLNVNDKIFIDGKFYVGEEWLI